MLELVLNDCVTDTNETLWASNSSISLAKSASERVSRSTLYTTTMSAPKRGISTRLDGRDKPGQARDPAGVDVGQELLHGRPVEGSPRERPIVIMVRDKPPAFTSTCCCPLRSSSAS